MGKPGRPKGLPSFHRVQAAKEILANSAATLARDVLRASKVAAKRGNHAPAVWALEHIAALDSAGKEVRPVASGIDRQVVDGGSRMPVINIGWVVKTDTPALPTVEVLALPDSSDPSKS